MTAGFKEKLKTAILVVLFLTTILLLYLNMSYGQRRLELNRILSIRPGRTESLSISDFIRADYTVISDGSGSFRADTKNCDEATKKALEIVGSLSGKRSLVVSEISEDIFYSLMADYRSVSLYFPFALPEEGISGLSDMEILVFSGSEAESFFVKDGQNRYYRVLSDRDLKGVELLLPLLDPEEASLFFAGTVLGGSSRSLVTLAFEQERTEAGMSRERFDDAELASGIFGDSFDFVRRYSDSFGNVSYLQGYGSRRLSFSSDGSAEYKAEGGSAQEDFAGSLETALSFLSKIYGESVLEHVRLSELRQSGTRVKSYDLCFDFYGRGLPVKMDEPLAEISVSGGTVSSARFSNWRIGFSSEGESFTTAEATNIIANDCKHIYSRLSGGSSGNADEAFSYVADHLIKIKAVYFARGKGPGRELEQAWLIRFENMDFYYSAVDGRLLAETERGS